MTQKTKIVTKNPKERRKKVTFQTQNATKTVKSLSWMTLMETATRRKLKKKIGFDYIKRSTKKSGRTEEGSQRCLQDRNAKENEMDSSSEDRFTPRNKMNKESNKMESRTAALEPKHTEQWEDQQKEVGRRH